MHNMQHQYWVTKKSVLRKLGGKEDDCVVSSDAELDAKLELFKSINESCLQLQRVIDLYQERLCYLAQEENALGRYLKESGKNEKNASAGQIMATTGKALAYIGHQRVTIRSPLVRLHHEVETFRGRAVSDTRATVSEMEKARTEYRAALSWMKSVSSQLDPDTGHGLEQFRKAQSYVKTAKTKFDRLTLVCLQKVDLLAAARCNMFSHAIVPYQSALQLFSHKAAETLLVAAGKLSKVQPYEFSVVTELVSSNEEHPAVDKDRNTFFNSEYNDHSEEKRESVEKHRKKECNQHKPKQENEVSNLLGEEFPPSTPADQLAPLKLDDTKPSSALFSLNWPSGSEVFGNNLMPSNFIQEGLFNFTESEEKKGGSPKEADKKPSTNPKWGSESKENNMSWLSLFAELDPLANPVLDNNSAGDRA